jgi:hypothetical protein
MNRNTVSLGPPSGFWSAEWYPAEGGGGDLHIVYHHEAVSVVVHERYHQNEPADDDTLRRWAAEQLINFADGWRPREIR